MTASRTGLEVREARKCEPRKGYDMLLKQRIVLILMNVAMLAELTVSIYLSSSEPEYFTALFCKYFFSMLIPTLIIARIVVKRLGAAATPVSEYSASCDHS